MKPLFICYPKCGTCRKAAGWLKEMEIDTTVRDIAVDNPTSEELSEWIGRSGLPVQKFFNTSGLLYKELNLKDKVRTASEKELINILASNGMLVKRPLLIADDLVLVGFKEEEWSKRLKR